MKKTKRWLASLSLLGLLALTSCDAEQAADNISESVEGTVANVLPNLYVALAQLGAFLVMVFIFFKFAYKPIKARILARSQHIEDNISEAMQKKREADLQLEDAKAKLNEAKDKANVIVANASKEAEVSAQKILDHAASQAEEIRKQGEKDAEEIKRKVDRKAHDEIVTTAIEASKEILGREVSREDNEKVVNAFLEKMKEDHSEE